MPLLLKGRGAPLGRSLLPGSSSIRLACAVAPGQSHHSSIIPATTTTTTTMPPRRLPRLAITAAVVVAVASSGGGGGASPSTRPCGWLAPPGSLSAAARPVVPTPVAMAVAGGAGSGSSCGGSGSAPMLAHGWGWGLTAPRHWRSSWADLRGPLTRLGAVAAAAAGEGGDGRGVDPLIPAAVSAASAAAVSARAASGTAVSAAPDEEEDRDREEGEEEMTPAAFSAFWREERGLVSRKRLGQLAAAAEAHPLLRRRAVLAPALKGMEEVRDCLLAWSVFMYLFMFLFGPCWRRRWGGVEEVGVESGIICACWVGVYLRIYRLKG